MQGVPDSGGHVTHVVLRHYRYLPGPWPEGARLPVGEPLDREECPGGAIDLVKDRVP
ncbi:hypothetical protein [Streptomyces mutabilis]|uniref:hypothetical protein n=1 Tax=Streptomyces mutabilis TaxID=67332 RepID=UPI003427D395